MAFYLYILMNVFLWYFAKLGSEIKWMLVSTPWQQLLHFIHSEWTVTWKPSLGKKVSSLKKKWSVFQNHICLGWNFYIIFKLRKINLSCILKYSLLILITIKLFYVKVMISGWVVCSENKCIQGKRKLKCLNVIFNGIIGT